MESCPTECRSTSSSGCPKDDDMPRGPTTIEQPPSDTPMAASNPVCQVFSSSALSPTHHASVEGFVPLGGTAVRPSLGPKAEVLFDSVTQRTQDPNGEVILPLNITILIYAWHDITANGIRLMGRNLYFLFCCKACPDGIILDRGILLSRCYCEQ